MGRLCACFNLRKAARRITSYYDGILRPSGLKTSQMSMLTALRALAPINMKRLAKVVGMDRTTLTRNLAVLSKRGLVEIQTGPDQRTRTLLLSPAGHAALADAYPLWVEAQRTLQEKLGGDQFESLVQGLSHVSRLIRTETG
jgi:DNA-binding MarR family transcriptional regulator